MLERQIWICICHSCLSWVTAFESVIVKEKKKGKAIL